jgi:dsDNA-specific endonuclease/ATPase MutS2
MTTFVAGDRVHVATLGTGVVREVRNGGRYLIDLKGRSMVVAGSQLELAPERRAAKPHQEKKPHPAARQHQERRGATDSAAVIPVPSRALDLHGKTVLEALDALDSFLNEALLDGCDDVQVIHGRSGGKVKAAVHARLRQLPSVRAFRLDPTNPGATMVRL